MGDANLLTRRYVSGNRVVCETVSSGDLPPCLDLGRGGRKLGLFGEQEQKETLKSERGNDGTFQRRKSANAAEKAVWETNRIGVSI